VGAPARRPSASEAVFVNLEDGDLLSFPKKTKYVPEPGDLIIWNARTSAPNPRARPHSSRKLWARTPKTVAADPRTNASLDLSALHLQRSRLLSLDPFSWFAIVKQLTVHATTIPTRVVMMGGTFLAACVCAGVRVPYCSASPPPRVHRIVAPPDQLWTEGTQRRAIGGTVAKALTPTAPPNTASSLCKDLAFFLLAGSWPHSYCQTGGMTHQVRVDLARGLGKQTKPIAKKLAVGPVAGRRVAVAVFSARSRHGWGREALRPR